jgi:DNA-binding CsgD family transcriptional regulator
MRPRGRTLAVGDAVPSLVCYGRSPDADLVYRHLVMFGPGTSAALAHDLGMSGTRVAGALDELAAARAVLAPVRAEHPWRAMEPAAVIGGWRRAMTTGPVPPAAVDRQAIARAAGADPLRLGTGVRYLPSRAATRARLAELVAVARDEHVSMHPDPVFDDSARRAADPMDRELLERGVRMRMLGVQCPDLDHLTRGRPVVRPVYRRSGAVPAKLLVVDRRVALFPVSPEDLERGYLEVTQPPVVAALVALFEQHWATAEEPQECVVPPIALGPRERLLVALLAAGHTDATAARELRISARSVSTTVRGLMDRVGVSNRFQLGLALGAAHTVDPPGRPGVGPEPGKEEP